MKKCVLPLLPIVFAFICGTAYAQQPALIKEGMIEFEKKTDVYSLVEKFSSVNGGEEGVAKYKRMNPQFQSATFQLYFSGSKTLYKPLSKEGSGDNEILDFLSKIASGNIIYSDLSLGQSVSQKSVLGNLFLVKDSIHKIKWKLKEETRDIAGFHCRRADGIILDSVYVVAFYCDQFSSEGGPESFGGLPGMALGIALPDRNITWFATKVMAQPITTVGIIPPAGGKEVNNTAFRTTLQGFLKSNKFASFVIERSML